MSGKDFMTNYLKRINDLENPLPSDSKIFLPERSVKDGPKYQSTEVKMSGSRTKEENERLREEYFKSVTEPATLTLDTFPSDRVTEVLDGKGWIVPQLLSPEECEEVIQLGEDWGIGEEDFKVAQELRIRTSNRTNSYCNEELTTRINPRLPDQLLEAVERRRAYSGRTVDICDCSVQESIKEDEMRYTKYAAKETEVDEIYGDVEFPNEKK